MGGEEMSISLRPYLPHDVPLLAHLFRTSISELSSDDYDEAQIEAWLGVADDDELWAQKFADTLTLIAFVDQEPAGFITLKGKDELDMLYVAPHFARQNVASSLLTAIEKLAHARGVQTLIVDASDSAEAFFKARGFTPQKRNTIMLADVFIGTTTMTKSLTPQTEH